MHARVEFSFSLCAITIVASMSSTMTSARSVPATLDAGNAAGQLGPHVAPDLSTGGRDLVPSTGRH